MTETQALTALAAIALAGASSQYLAWRLRLPAILFLLSLGLLLGPVSGWLKPDLLFGDLLFPMVSLSVALILFEGGLTLKFSDIRELQLVVRRMIGIGSLISGLVSGLAAWFFTGLDWRLCTIFGALMVVTGPTVVVPMLRAVRPTQAVARILKWEGIVIDPLGALLTLLAFELILAMGSDSHSHGFLQVVGNFLGSVAVGMGLGAMAGQMLGEALRRHWLPEYLHNAITFNLVLALFVIANLLAEEAGVLAVTVMGIWLANMRAVSVNEILNFKESLSVLLVSGLFIILAARIDPNAFARIGLGGLLVFAVMQFLARPLKVAFAARGSTLTLGERVMIAWIGPRGIVAAAIAALISLRLDEIGVPGAELLVPLVFSIIIATVLFQGATAGLLARWLGVAEPEPKGFLLIGANRLARAIAKALERQGFNCVLADGDWENIRQARMDGLTTFYGRPVSEHADQHLELIGIGCVLGLAADPEQNALAALRYRAEFGAGGIYCLAEEAGERDSRHRIGERARGEILFAEDAGYGKLIAAIDAGAEIRATTLTDAFDESDLERKQWKKATRLAAVDPKGRIHLYTSARRPTIGPGWTVLALVMQEREGEPA
ncbi:MAG: cation:proton antiporter [Gammaproteobacteria bacterium]|nr:cation:proton antiporter [Gammaproteobacteria bacterium]MBU1653380.1 cation:proton antiporter [Gammaproteobacteria bacterium]MBU1960833.1 cation:proton antiporter [Gammaproteobacteria bacterium]